MFGAAQWLKSTSDLKIVDNAQIGNGKIAIIPVVLKFGSRRRPVP